MDHQQLVRYAILCNARGISLQLQTDHQPGALLTAETLSNRFGKADVWAGGEVIAEFEHGRKLP